MFKSVLRYVLPFCVFILMPLMASVQRFTLIDMEHVLKNVSAYERTNEQLNQVGKKWQAEVGAFNTEASTMYEGYQNEVVFLSQDRKKERQEAIMAKEKQASDLKHEYSGSEGELSKKRTSLITPIQGEVYNTVKGISDQRGYSLVIGRSSNAAGIIYGPPKVDINNETSQKLGYSYQQVVFVLSKLTILGSLSTIEIMITLGELEILSPRIKSKLINN